MKVLVIEDEQGLREQLQKKLQSKGFGVDVADNGKDGHFLGSEYPLDVAVVDLGLPGMSGIEVIKSWRDQGLTFPILILTARSNWQDKVEGLEAGADDYLSKPFHFEELLARLNALLRRASGHARTLIKAGNLKLDSARQEVFLEDKLVELTSYEYRVIEFLMMHAGEVISKTTLTEHIYDQDFDRDSNVLEVFVGRLRKKLDPDGSMKPIETLRGRGYRFALSLET